MIVVDASAIYNALVYGADHPTLRERLLGEWMLHVPYLLDVEMLHALRRVELLGAVSSDRAYEVRNDLSQLPLIRYPEHPYADAMWDLRHNVSPYDAAYVTLAEALGATLVTCDARLARAPGHAAAIELYD
jgi:predicted nucleic acid-binding protein